MSMRWERSTSGLRKKMKKDRLKIILMNLKSGSVIFYAGQEAMRSQRLRPHVWQYM